jgi:hypothetical protein
MGILIAGIAVPATAQANPNQVSIMQDDDLLVYRDDATRDAAMRKMKGLGVDVVRVTLLWDRVAEDARKTKALDKRFRKLGADDPRAYPRLNWDRYDRLVRAGRTLGINILFNITGPGPKWAHGKAPKGTPSAIAKAWRPKEREFYKFVQAVGKRYSGNYRDENDGRQRLPRVGFWSLWNEPNQAGWLAPQFAGNKPVAPDIYRKLWFFGYRALVSTGHTRSLIMVGETAPIGRNGTTSRTPIKPRAFIRQFFCLDNANGPGCSDFEKYGAVKTGAWAHHPYTKKNAPNVRESDPEALTLANINDLAAILDEAAAAGRVAPNLPIMNTEFGYETNPPDPFQGIPLKDQAQNMVTAEFMQFLNPRIIGTSQFLLADVAPVRKHKKNSKAYWFTYQSGLFNRSGVAKPAAGAYSFPFAAFPTAVDPATGARNVTTWGHMRFRPNGAADFVNIEWKPFGGPQWFPVAASVPVTNFRNYFQAEVSVPGPGTMRATWSGAQSPFTAVSHEAIVG